MTRGFGKFRDRRKWKFRSTFTWWPSSKQLGLGVYLWWSRADVQLEVQFLIFYFSVTWMRE